MAAVAAAHEQDGATRVVDHEARGVADRVGTGASVHAAASEQHDELRIDHRSDRADLSPRLADTDLGEEGMTGRLARQAALGLE